MIPALKDRTVLKETKNIQEKISKKKKEFLALFSLSSVVATSYIWLCSLIQMDMCLIQIEMCYKCTIHTGF